MVLQLERKVRNFVGLEDSILFEGSQLDLQFLFLFDLELKVDNLLLGFATDIPHIIDNFLQLLRMLQLPHQIGYLTLREFLLLLQPIILHPQRLHHRQLPLKFNNLPFQGGSLIIRAFCGLLFFFFLLLEAEGVLLFYVVDLFFVFEFVGGFARGVFLFEGGAGQAFSLPLIIMTGLQPRKVFTLMSILDLQVLKRLLRLLKQLILLLDNLFPVKSLLSRVLHVGAWFAFGAFFHLDGAGYVHEEGVLGVGFGYFILKAMNQLRQLPHFTTFIAVLATCILWRLLRISVITMAVDSPIGHCLLFVFGRGGRFLVCRLLRAVLARGLLLVKSPFLCQKLLRITRPDHRNLLLGRCLPRPALNLSHLGWVLLHEGGTGPQPSGFR